MNYQDGNKKNSIKILVSDFNRLEPSVYLNDTLILFFLKFLQNYVLTPSEVSQLHIFNSFFMQMITQYSDKPHDEGSGSSRRKMYDIQFQKMKRWTRSIDLFEKQYIFVPICENEHWSLAIIC